MIGKIIGIIFSRGLWNRRFCVALAGSCLTILAFDVLWCRATANFYGLTFLKAYLFSFLLAMLMALPALLRRRWVFGAVLVVADLLAQVNLMYARTYMLPIPLSSYLLGGNVLEFRDSIIHSLRWADIVFPAITILTLVLIGRRRHPFSLRAFGAYCLTFGAGAFLCFFAGRADSSSVLNPLAQIRLFKAADCHSRALIPVIYTLPLSLLSDALETSRPVTELEIEEARAYLAEHRAVTDLIQLDNIASPRRNLVLIMVESLEAWPLGASVEGNEITPELNRLIADSTSHAWVAPAVLSQVGPGHSIDGQLLTTAGLRPTMDKVYSMWYSDRTYPNIAKEMRRDRDVKSYFLSSDYAITWNQGGIVRQFGFDEMRMHDAWVASEYFDVSHNPSDGSLLRQVAEAMRCGEIWPEGETAFVEVFTYSSHTPFIIPEEHRGIHLLMDYPQLLGEYITAINYTDSALGEFIRYVRSRSDADETMIAIVGDHEGLPWRNEIISAMPEAAALVDSVGHVPLIVLNSPITGRCEREIGQVDVYPTLLYLAGLYRDADFRGVGYPAFADIELDAAADARQQSVSSTIIRADLLKQIIP